jgi:hypothetical protein
MQIEEMIRDASAELRSATEYRPLPTPRFAAVSTTREKRRRWQMALAALVALSVAALVVRSIDRDRDPSQIDTVVPPSTTVPSTTTVPPDEPPPSFLPAPANLPNYVGYPWSSLSETLARWKVNYELAVEPGVQDPSRGRIIDQQPGGGTPLTAGMRVTFKVGRPTAPIAGELEIGSASSGPRGAWRVAASAKANPTDGKLEYSMSFLTDETTYIGGGNTLDANIVYDHASKLGLVAGTAPASAVAVLLLDSTGNTVGSVDTTRSDDPRLASVSYWVIEVAKHPVYTSLRAIDRDGNRVADLIVR